MRASFQALLPKLAAGMTGQLDPTEAEKRATPAGRLVPLDEPWELPCPRCGGGVCVV
jgi:hypothetical protein